MKKSQEKPAIDSCAEGPAEIEELRKTLDRYRALFDRNPCPMCVYDEDTREILEVNPSALALRELSRQDFLALSIDDLQPDEAILETAVEVDYDGRKARLCLLPGEVPRNR